MQPRTWIRHLLFQADVIPVTPITLIILQRFLASRKEKELAP